MRYKVITSVKLRKFEDHTESTDPTLYPNQIVVDVEPPQQSDERRKVRLTYDDGSFVEGWVLKTAAPPDINQPAMPPMANFVIGCLDAVYVVNQLNETAPNYVSLDFLLARAKFETDNTYPAPVAGQAFGPFRIRSEEWSDFRTTCPVGKDLPDHFVEYVSEQARAAAWSMVTSGRRLVAAYSTLDQEHEQTYEPDLLDLFLSHILNNSADAARTRRAADAGNTTAINIFLNDNAEVPLLMQGPHADLVLESGAAARSVSDFVTHVATTLDALLQQAYAAILQHAPNYLAQTGGGTPWMGLARQEIGVLETDSAKIRAYFAAIGITADGATAWCGAFVAWCLLQARAVAQKDLPRVPERAANWVTFGRPVALPLNPSDPSLNGAIVILSPQTAKSSGHVGFLVGFDSPGKVILLGGNQHDQVREQSFPIADIRAVRWPDFDQTDKLMVGGSQAFVQLNLKGYSADQKQAALLIVRLFAEAGYDELHQRIAVANASAESSLFPGQRNRTEEEDSVGLFQLNRKGGQGETFSVEQLQDPEFNTRRILVQAKKISAFQAENDEVEAMKIFIRQIEIAAYSTAELSRRMGIYYALKS
ncbi:TIGR02594 family protein [Rhizobium sophoriradicis]|uniref:TIGR02594 family protein n=1 Tax=Rhizobium sophoriradicis TaxID=1535245 RepID=A0A2A5KKI3_9HYPH|nr:TIGR02594 family protein [Rhizobium sophoriradicis]PCK77505.1 hypothetical protein CPT34_29775 [Rhizobium sophoriradicis]